MKFKTLALICVGLMLSSCAIVTPISQMEKNYSARMTTAEELSAKAHIQIFLNEKDVPYDYEVLALLKYKPWVMPVIMPERGKMLRKFYKKAVLKAEQIGGDAIIVESMGFCKVITAPNQDGETKADNRKEQSVFRVFEDGAFADLTPKEKDRYANALQDEIKDGIDKCKTREDVEAISQKINALEEYYSAEGKKTKKIDSFRKDLSEAEAKITKKENRANKISSLKEKVKEKLNNKDKEKKN